MTRYLALDVGEERIGVAISDELGMLARPLTVLARVAGPSSFHELAEIIRREGVTRIVVGLPLREDRTAGKQVASTEAYVRGLSQHVQTPIVYWDERYSTDRARDILRETSRRNRPARDDLDAVAAAVILQDYIDSGAEEQT